MEYPQDFWDTAQAQPSSERAQAAQRAVAEMESNWRQIRLQHRLELSGVQRGRRWDDWAGGWDEEVKTMRSQLESEVQALNRRALFTSSGSASSVAERSSAAAATEMMDRSSAKLTEAKRVALETEEVGQGVLSDLATQRETILNVRGNVRTIDSELTSARRSLDRMLALAQRNRITTLVIAGVFSLGISFWILCVLGLSLKSTLLLAIAMVLLLVFLLTVRRRLQTGRWELPIHY